MKEFQTDIQIWCEQIRNYETKDLLQINHEIENISDDALRKLLKSNKFLDEIEIIIPQLVSYLLYK